MDTSYPFFMLCFLLFSFFLQPRFFSLHNNDKQRLSRTSAARSGMGGHCPPTPVTPMGRTHHSDADGVLVLLCEDAHQGRGQEQQDQGVLELKNEKQCGVILSSFTDIRDQACSSGAASALRPEPGFQAGPTVI